MPSKILVAYATCTGSTVGVAEAIAKTLAESGAAVDIRPIQDVTDLTPYHAVVLGSAIQDKKWLPEAMQFVRKNQAALSQKPFAAFLVCMTLAMKNQNYHGVVTEWLQPVRQLVKPVSEGFFAGVLDIAKVPSLRQRLMFRISVWTGVWAEGDHRDWEAIRAWASDLNNKLQAPKP
ncbi:MAG: flavodoxin domain-containing protein [Anaerolineae bacterium]|nr:flavodoxin domain-containing protein [Anaerolineae bacterium]